MTFLNLKNKACLQSLLLHFMKMTCFLHSTWTRLDSQPVNSILQDTRLDSVKRERRTTLSKRSHHRDKHQIISSPSTP